KLRMQITSTCDPTRCRDASQPPICIAQQHAKRPNALRLSGCSRAPAYHLEILQCPWAEARCYSLQGGELENPQNATTAEPPCGQSRGAGVSQCHADRVCRLDESS